MLGMQAGDVHTTGADITKAQNLVGYKPKTSIVEGIKRFVEWYKWYEIQKALKKGVITTKCYARCGLMGNPSDQFGGKTICFTISNFFATVVVQNPKKEGRIEVVPNEQFDSNTFEDFSALHRKCIDIGYYGGIRLIKATCKKFFAHVQKAV